MEKKQKRILIGVLCGAAVLAGAGVGIAFGVKSCNNKTTETHTVTFAADPNNSEGVQLSQDRIVVKDGTKFGDIKSQVTPSKVTGEGANKKDWVFKYWKDKDGRSIDSNFVITSNLTVYAHFVQPDPTKILIRFTVDPADAEGVRINIPAYEINKNEATFAWVASHISATKVIDDVEWEFKWWYRDGYPSDWKMSDDQILTETLEVHPYFLPPPEAPKFTVAFDAGESGGTILSDTTTSFEVKQGAPLKDIITENNIRAVKEGYDFQYWTVSLSHDVEDPEWLPPSEISDSYTISENIVLYPYFVLHQQPWVQKNIVWESNDEGQSYRKDFTLPDDQFVFNSSNFLLKDENDADIALQEGETVSATISECSVEDLISANVISNSDQMSNRINVQFTIDSTKSFARDTTISFAVTLSIYFNGELKKTFTINGFTFLMRAHIDPVQISFVSDEASATELVTDDGYKSFYFDSKQRKSEDKSYYAVSRKPTNDETIEAVVEGENADDVTIKDIDVVKDDNDYLYYLNFDASFKKLIGLGYDHIAKFKLSFVVKYNTSGEETPSTGNKNFILKFNAIEGTPYAVAVDKEYTLSGMSWTLPFRIQVEKDPEKAPTDPYPRFKEGHYMTATNTSKSSNCPVFFTTPQEERRDFNEVVPLQGDNTTDADVEIIFDFSSQAPMIKTSYTCDVTFAFYDSNIIDEAHFLNDCKRQITFTFDPFTSDDKEYTNEEWAQAHSFGIVQKATNKGTGEEEISVGTTWPVRSTAADPTQANETTLTFVTAYDIKKDSLKFQGDNYENYKIGIISTNAGRQYIRDDSTKYYSLSEDDSDVYYFDYNNRDFFEWQNDLKWGDSLPAIGPAESVFKMLFQRNNLTKFSPNSKFALLTYIWPQLASFTAWSPIDGTAYQQTAPLFTGEDIPFLKSKYAYGYVGGFKSTKLMRRGQLTDGLYWKGFEMNMGNGELDLVGTGTYSLFCKGSGKELGDDISHVCPAFVTIWDSLSKSKYLDNAGRGAMFMLRTNDFSMDRTLGYPEIAGINWFDGENGRSKLNILSQNVTPYFDCFVYDTSKYTLDYEKRNLLFHYWTSDN